MSVHSIINLASKFLEQQDLRLKVSQENICRAGDPNYGAKDILSTDIGTFKSPEGHRLTLGNALYVTSKRDAIADESIRVQKESTSNFREQYLVKEKTRMAMGETVSLEDDAPGAIANAMQELWSAFHKLSAKTDEITNYSNVLDKANTFIRELHNKDLALKSLDEQSAQVMDFDIDRIHDLFDQIAVLNKDISFDEAKPEDLGTATSLRERRQSKFEELATYVNCSISYPVGAQDKASEIEVKINGVLFLKGTEVKDRIIRDTSGNGVDVKALTQGSILNLEGGRIFGIQDARKNTIPKLQQGLDNLAEQIVIDVNAAYNPTTASGGNFFDASGTKASTIQLESGLTVQTLKTTDSGNKGGNELAKNVANLREKTHETGSGDKINGSFRKYFKALIVEMGQDIKVTKDRYDASIEREKELLKNRKENIGVSMDVEGGKVMEITAQRQAMQVIMMNAASGLREFLSSISART